MCTRSGVVFLVSTALLAASVPAASAQDHLLLEGIHPIRVTAVECSIFHEVGEIRGSKGDSLRLRIGNEDLICPLESVDRLEVAGTRRHWSRDATVGALIGGALGAAVMVGAGPQGGLVVLPAALVGAGVANGPWSRKATLIGGLVGVGIGASLGAALCATEDGGEYDWSPAGCAFFLGLVGLPAGAVSGAMVGLLRGEDWWIDLPLPEVRPFGLLAPKRGPALGLSLTWRR